MIRRRLWISLLGITLTAVILLVVNLAAGNEPALGLDLRGGVSVVLAPTEDATGDDLLTIRDLIRDELEDRGIGEPDVRVEGERIVVDLPGVKDQRDALDAVDVAGIVTLRPVLQSCAEPVEETVTSSVPDSSVPDSSVPDSSAPDGSAPDSSAPPSSGADSSVPETSAPSTTEEGPAGFANAAAPTQTTTPATSEPITSTSEAGTDTSEPAPPSTDATTTTTTEPPLGPLGPIEFDTGEPSPFTPPPPADEDSTVTLTDRDGLECIVGPVQRGPNSELSGFLFGRDSAEAILNQGAWEVNVGLTPAGETAFNTLVASCFNRDQATCPTGQIAIVMDGVVQSTPVVNDQSYAGGVTISGTFSESDARDLARVLNRGAFPVQVEAQNVQTVSATLGQDSLRASIFAALVGVVLVLALLLFFYRRLILVVVLGLAVWAMLIYSAAAIISQATNFALTLAGVAGIVVAIGVTVDSYVVYFERMKDEVRHGRTIRNSALRSFRSTWRTVLAADFVSFLAAMVLFILSVGSVRGFALYLGITTVCDVIVCYFFTRAAVGLLADTGWLDEGDTFGLKEYE
jgi:preprotein translocase subunit SecD